MKREAVRWLFLALAVAVSAEKWKFPDGGASVRIDTKVQFVDEERPSSSERNYISSDLEADDPAPFQPARDTAGFYNRPADAPGRYPVRVETHEAYRAQPHRQYSDGTLDSMLQCKCVTNPDCSPGHDTSKVCGPGKYLCCAKRPGNTAYPNPEFFNEINDERPQLYPGKDKVAGPFPPPPISAYSHDRDAGVPQQTPVLIGPGGPAGDHAPSRPILVGPDGPTGIIGPGALRQNNPGVLVGPDGPTGVIGPNNLDDRYTAPSRDVGSSESAQRGILVGPGGPTGIIGPAGYGRRPVLVGPGGPTGIIGPYGYGGGQMRNPGLLVGPGGPTGIIGPGRQILVGPGGPTGHIGPRRPFYYADPRPRCPRHRNRKSRVQTRPGAVDTTEETFKKDSDVF
ncbi:collagen alpha-1(I) chain-like [Amyelois transitella]|uniref:collagen alpha-1(I) chain-like n=1 Tax=Amyelois transitella TaxID=680683 RepID=UPI00298FDCE9|nr:collagen alpha-1(I) chain-like [Amyelois transitella]